MRDLVRTGVVLQHQSKAIDRVAVLMRRESKEESTTHDKTFLA
jgi:hypothetical protein